jgi:hypothetical protein
MFYGEKEQVKRALHKMQREVCQYDSFRHPDPPDFCDCKYGFDEDHHLYSEKCGCPELRTVVELLDKMTEEEYNRILSR